MGTTQDSVETSPDATFDDLDAANRRIDRLNRRLARERRAREEAEGIADRRLRELWLSNQELDQRVAERTEDVKKAYALLEESFAAATRFVSNLSHEMLTPLNGIIGMLELIGQHSHTDALTGYVTTARKSTDRLHLLVRRLLDLVQLSAGLLRAAPTEFEISELVDAIEKRWRVRCLQDQKLLTVSTTIEQGHTVTADFERLLQIVDEVIDNARLHADPGVLTVQISLVAGQASATDETEAHLQVVIADNGPGFTPSDSDGIFDAILHVDTSPGRTTEGAGIGLGLAKELARALRGSLDITSALGSATSAVISIPV